MPYVFGSSPDGQEVKIHVTKRSKTLDLTETPISSIDLLGIAEKAPNLESVFFRPNADGLIKNIDLTPLCELTKLVHVSCIVTDKIELSRLSFKELITLGFFVEDSVDFKGFENSNVQCLYVSFGNPIKDPFSTMCKDVVLEELNIGGYPQGEFLSLKGLPRNIQNLKISEDAKFSDTEALKNTYLRYLNCHSGRITHLPNTLTEFILNDSNEKLNFKLLQETKLLYFTLDAKNYSSEDIQLEYLPSTVKQIKISNCPNDLNLDALPEGVELVQLELTANPSASNSRGELIVPERIVKKMGHFSLDGFFLGEFDTSIFEGSELKTAWFHGCDWEYIYADHFWKMTSLTYVAFDSTRKVIVSPELLDKPRTCKNKGMKRYLGMFDSY
ncbi:hypothetical protein [Veronia pacifica]|uniref:Uncharacterized protein n=1 Tax=Veronia pacifica TaxID=1080227 RepID=A0A1C3ECL6_9GAMM|nr:hypothetical protein [Veronia pacifica]ODA30996.1 hypothetical protein A8L45_18335 [Veronia pacifica]